MRRLMIVTNSLTGGGAERSMNLLSAELSKRGWKVFLVPINAGIPDLINPNCEILPLNRRHEGNFLQTMTSIVRFNRIVLAKKPEVIVLNCDLPELLGALLIRFRKVIAVEHSSIPWIKRPKLGRFVRQLLRFRRVTWVAVSDHLSIWPNSEKPRLVLQNSITPPENREAHSCKGVVNRLVYIGRLSPEKRPRLALEIARDAELEICLIGDGELSEQLKFQSIQESIEAEFLGHVQDPWSNIRTNDLLIVTSAFEGDGLVVLEGLQRNVPLLLADIPEFRRLGLPNRNYCSDVCSFVNRIAEFKNRSGILRAPKNMSESLLRVREAGFIASEWEHLIYEISS
jgi:glycosyltransferase involved in cell wall biosynthesis